MKHFVDADHVCNSHAVSFGIEPRISLVVDNTEKTKLLKV